MSKNKLLLLALAGLPLLAAAQDTTKVSALAEVTVTALRTEERVLNTPRSVSVITSADIQKQPYQNLADLLQRYEGIFIPGTFQNPGSLQTLYLRGADNKQTLLMIDGVRLTDASTPDNGLDLNEVSLNSIERIEIVRGSQGTLYGGSAVGGVINIITKKNAAAGTTGIAKIKAGSFGDGTLITEAQAGITYTAKSGFYSRAEILNITSNGFNSSLPAPNTNIPAEDDDFRKTDYAAKIGFNKTSWNGYLGYRYSQQKADIDDGAFSDDDNNVLKFHRNLLTYGLTHNLRNNLSIKFFGGYTGTERKNFDDSSLVSRNPNMYDGTVSDSKYTGKNLTNEVQLNYKNQGLALVGGVAYNRDKMNTRADTYFRGFSFKTNYDTVGIKMSTAAVYAHARYEIPFSKPGFGLNLAGGVRYSNNDRFGDFVSYEFTPNLMLGQNVSLFASLATGYNAPSLYQLFAPEKNFSSGISRGSQALKPEESQSVELGAKVVVSDKVGFRLSVYHNEVKNYIDYVYLWNGSKAINSLNFADFRGDTYLNTGKQTNEGIEAGLDINFSEKWQLRSNVSYNDGQLEYNPSFIDQGKIKGNHVQVYSNGAFLNSSSTNNELIRRPKFISNTSLTFKPTSKWQLTADARTVGNRSDVTYDYRLGPYGALGRTGTEDFQLFNLSALWQATSKFSVGVSVFNVLDEKYVELNGFQTRGRSGFATAQYNF